MEEIVATIFLRRLNSLLREKSKIFGGLEDEILLLKSQLSHLNSHIQPFQRELVEIGYSRPEFDYSSTEEYSATSNISIEEEEDGATSKILSIELKESIHNWLVRFRETIHDADDCIDLFIIRMNNSKDGLDDSDRIVAAALLGCELRIINECLVEILDAKSQLDTSIASLSIELSAIIDDEGENSFTAYTYEFIHKFITLPIGLRSCSINCCFYLRHANRDKSNLAQLLTAIGAIEEIPGERMEDIAEGNIDKLIELGTIKVSEGEPGPRLFRPCNSNTDRHFDAAAGDEYLYILKTYTNIPLNVRHVSIYADESVITSFLKNIRNSSIRSLVIHCPLSNPLEMKLYNFKLLRVLELFIFESDSIRMKGVRNLIHLEGVGNLIHLRYLKLFIPSLTKLPESIGNLRNLQTLLITCSPLKEVPSGILNLSQLRHLQISRIRSREERTLALIGIGRLTNLQTLSGLYVGDGIGSELNNLTQIRELGIVQLMEKDASELYASIMKMTGLLSLSLSASARDSLSYNEEEILPSLEPLPPPPLLQKLRLVGCIQEIPDWFSSMKNLTQLVLTHSYLLENPVSVLESLPNLKFLALRNAYTARYIGREFCRSGGFPTLQTLIIRSESLIEWTELEQGSFPSLKFLQLSCSNLRTLPEGLQLITTLQKLHIFDCHGDLARKLSPDGGPENYKIRPIPRTTKYDKNGTRIA